MNVNDNNKLLYDTVKLFRGRVIFQIPSENSSIYDNRTNQPAYYIQFQMFPVSWRNYGSEQ